MATNEAIQPLIRQLLEWAAAQPRTYAEAMEAWRSSCPRLTVWEDALSAGLIKVCAAPREGFRAAPVRVTAQGHSLLRATR